MEVQEIARRVEAVRRFNRFYTRQIGLLEEGLLRSPFTLAEARVIYEIAQRETTSAKELAAELRLDGGYLSRILKRFEKQGHIERRRDEGDGRRSLLSLTEEGRAAFSMLNGRSHDDIEAMLKGLVESDRTRLLAAMKTIERILGAGEETRAPYILRPPAPGDFGWVVARHGAIYAQEQGWDEHFEALVAEIMAHYVEHYDRERENGWIAEREGENLGCVFIVKKSATVAKLRCLLVEPGARGMGIGSRLVDECIRFARRKGYRKITLWTHSVLLAARRIYAAAGFQLVKQEPICAFGHDLTSETWELIL